GNHTLVDWGDWYMVGWGPTIVTIVSCTIAARVLIKSFRWFVQLQWVMWYGFLLSYVLMVVLFLTTSNSAFAQRYDTASAFVAGGSGAYQAILNNAITNGCTPARTVAILGTILLFLMIIGIMLNAIQVVFNVIVGWTRVAVAMSIDGVLPKLVSHVSPRTHTPVYAHVIFLILGGYVFAYVYNLVPNYQVYTLA